MIGGLKPYPAMKDSGVEWLGEVPEHWELPRTKTVLSVRSQKGFPDEPMLAATQSKGVVRKEEYENRTVLALKDLHLLKLVCEGDFVISLRSFQGGIEYAREQGIISPAYTILFSDNPEDHGFLAHLFKSKPYIENLGLYVTGIRQGQNIDYEKLSRSRVPLPPLPEQAAIVRYLDHVDRRVRRLVRAKRKLIALLTEQKQAIIHRAVTRGLDPDVPLKDSGVEWLGEVPEHWEVRRLKFLIEGKLTYGANAAAEHQNPGWPRYLRITDFGVDGSLRSETFRSLPPEIAKDYLVQSGDLLLARSGATVGKAFLVKAEAGEACYAGYLIRARPRRSLIDPSFLFMFTQSSGFRLWKDSSFIIATIQNISAEKYDNLSVPTPPVNEQARISSYLNEATADINSAIARANREIELLKEYRTRLIADVVTGKLDVREAAAALPEEEEEEVLEEDELTEEDEEFEEALAE